MKRHEFHFELPNELIAQYPLKERSDSRLLVYDSLTLRSEHRFFNELDALLSAGDLLVMNNSKVMPARVFGAKESGGKVELLVERILDSHTFWAHIKASKSPKPDTLIHLSECWKVTVLNKEDALYLCKVNGDVREMLEEVGHVPLPPYITRQDETLDLNRYQTVYAEHLGSVAAPTAGLHFDEVILQRLKQKGINIAYTTLHVGAGTFQPVRSEDIRDHNMHREWFTVDASVCQAVKKAKANGHRVIAVGTTALRCLESAALGGELEPCQRETDIFIYPGFTFKVCEGLITNFHLPESTLLMLVSAFIGHREAMALYELAIKERYRFFSYGDASFLLGGLAHGVKHCVE